ncbi:MAG: hypothetical protein JO281_06735 [Pseudonocardiales bacterium]|nr:hypothetical protein [Pseudonocardiales bacterium]
MWATWTAGYGKVASEVSRRLHLTGPVRQLYRHAACRHVEQQFGDLGAVGGLVTTVSPATVRIRQHALSWSSSAKLGNTVAVEVTTWNGDPRWT